MTKTFCTLLVLLISSTALAKETILDTTLLLSQIVERGLLPLQKEPQETQNQLLEQAKKFSQHYTTRSNSSTIAEYPQYCQSHLETDPFCRIFQDFQLSQKNRLQKDRPPKKRALYSPHQVQKLILSAQLEKLLPLTEQELQEGLKRISSFTQISPLFDELAKVQNCSTSTLSSLLAAKTEEFLPETQAKQAAMRMYQKVTECATSEVQQVKARFRLSLLQIWNEDCPSALPHLQYLTQHNDGLNDYRSRALYWESFCHHAVKSPEQAEKSKKILLSQYPFSFHTLLIQGEDLEHRIAQTMQGDSPIEVRVQDMPEVNQKLRAIEALLMIKQNHLAKKVLKSLEDQWLKSKPAVQLYIAALYHQLDDSLTKFKLLTLAFRENPSLISKTSLKLYYPHKNWNSGDLYLSEVDEMLLLALIRQESAFNPLARSAAGALGLMQVMPHTARRYERMRTIKELFNPSTNLKIGTRYFAALLKNFNGDAGLALAAYNAGPKRVEDWLKRYPVKDKVLFLDLIPFKETREYVASIARNYYWYTSLYTEDHPSTAINQRTLNKVFTLSGT